MPPVNDDFANAIALSLSGGSATFSNVGSTTESGEPANGEGHSVWFKITPTSDVTITITTKNTPLPDWDSYLAVYTGSAVGSLVSVVEADDNDLQSGHVDSFGTSKVTWVATAGETYHIQVTAYDDVSGPVERADLDLTWAITAAPPDITSFTPTFGNTGDTVTIHGTGFTGATRVTIGGHNALFTVDSSTQITATVPPVYGFSAVTVITPSGSASGSRGFAANTIDAILDPGVAIPEGYYAGDWQTDSIKTGGHEGWLRVQDTVSANNKFWAVKVTDDFPHTTLLTKTTGTNDPGDARVTYYQDSLVELLTGVVIPADPASSPSLSLVGISGHGTLLGFYIPSISGESGFPDGAVAIQVEVDHTTPLGDARLPATINGNTHLVAADYYGISFYDAPWVSGKPAWSAGGSGDPDTSTPTIDNVATAAGYTFRDQITAVATGEIPLPDLSTWNTWADGRIGVALRGITTAAVEGLAPDLAGVGSGASFFGPSAGCDLLCQFPRYRWIYALPVPPAPTPVLAGQHNGVKQFFEEPTFTTAKLGVGTHTQGTPGYAPLSCGLVGVNSNTGWTFVDGKSQTVGWRGEDQTWHEAVKVPGLYNQGVAHTGYELVLPVDQVGTALVCFVGVNEDAGHSGIVFEATGSGAHLRLYRRGAVVLGDAVALPGDGDTVKVTTDFLAQTATLRYNGSVVDTLDFSGESWYTSDGSGL